MGNLKLLQLQLALFFEDIENRPDKFISKMMEVPNNVFDQMPIMLPIPPNAPPEIPAVILNSEDTIYTCNIAKSRIDFIVNVGNSSEENISVQLERFISRIRPYSNIVFGYKNIARFGFVAQYFYKTGTPVTDIQSKYLKHDLGNLEELNIRYNKRTQSNNLLLNNIVELSRGTFGQNQTLQDGLVIQRDINNVPVDGTSITIEDVFFIVKSKLSELNSDGIMGLLK